MQWLAGLSVRRPVLASVITLAMVFLGVFSYAHLNIERWPNIDIPIIVISITDPGASPEEIESDVTNKIEDAVNSISGIDHLSSTSAENVSIVVVQFVLEKNIDVAAQEIQNKINAIPDLPSGIDPPTVSKIDPGAFPVMTLALSANRPVRDISEYADKVLKPQLEGTPGVGQVTLIGDQPRQINVWVDPDLLASYGLPVTSVLQAVRNQNVQLPAGHVDQGNTQVTLRALSRITSPRELAHAGLAMRGGQPITIGDVARIEDGAADPVTTANVNGTPAVLLSIQKQSGTNALNVVRDIKARLRTITPLLTPGYNLRIVRDQSVFVEASTHAVQEHLIIGSILAALVVLVFLWNWRSTVIAALAIPTSIISTFALIAALGLTLNTITLLALALVVGIVIDDAIVVLENIYRLLREKGMPPVQAAIEGTREIGPAVTATTLSLIAVFLPLAFMSGIVGQFMRSFGWTMAFAIAVSLVVSFTLTPSLSSRWLKRAARTPDASGDDLSSDENGTPPPARPEGEHHRGRLYDAVDGGYRWLLEHALRRRWVVVVLTLLTLVSIGPLGAAVSKNFLPEDDESQLEVVVRAPEGWTLDATDRFATHMASEIRQLPGIDYTIVTAGDNPQNTPNRFSIFVKMVDVDKRSVSQQAMYGMVRDRILSRYAYLGLQTQVEQVSEFGGSGGFQPVDYVVSGPDLNVLTRAGDQGIRILRSIPGVVDARSSLVSGAPQLGMRVDRARAADLGVNAVDAANALYMLVQGVEAKGAKYTEAGQQYKIYIRADRMHRSNEEVLTQLPVSSPSQGVVDLEQVVGVSRGTGPSEITHYNRRRQVELTANLSPGTSQQAVLQQLDRKVRALGLGPEYDMTFAGQAIEQGRQAAAFMQSFMLSFVFMYLVLAAQFESWIHPVTILLSLPLTVPFALFSILFLHGSLNILSQLGILVLFGVVKKNAILQIDRANHLRVLGLDRDAAIVAASRDRLRPILMTTIAFVAGMIPLAISTGVGAATNRAMSTVIMGGQTLSLLLTLVAVPVMYSLFDDLGRLRMTDRIAGGAAGLWAWMSAALGLQGRGTMPASRPGTAGGPAGERVGPNAAP
ncbi:MAG TPA: efflux RND transporter permease subunit [bacterium]|nr:efflux RND transporter permease subunit [bacterium]